MFQANSLRLSLHSKLEIWLITQQTMRSRKVLKDCYYFLWKPFWANSLVTSNQILPPERIRETSRSREISHETANAPEKHHSWSRMVQTWPLSPFIFPALSVRIAAVLRFPRTRCVDGSLLHLSGDTWRCSNLIRCSHSSNGGKGEICINARSDNFFLPFDDDISVFGDELSLLCHSSKRVQAWVVHRGFHRTDNTHYI